MFPRAEDFESSARGSFILENDWEKKIQKIKFEIDRWTFLEEFVDRKIYLYKNKRENNNQIIILVY